MNRIDDATDLRPVPGILFHVLVVCLAVASLWMASDPTIAWFETLAFAAATLLPVLVLATWWVAGLIVVLDVVARRSGPAPWRRLVAAPLVAAAVAAAVAADAPLRWRLALSRASLESEVERVSETPGEDYEVIGRWVGALHVRSVTEVGETVRFAIGRGRFLVWSLADPSEESVLSCRRVAGDWHLCTEGLAYV